LKKGKFANFQRRNNFTVYSKWVKQTVMLSWTEWKYKKIITGLPTVLVQISLVIIGAKSLAVLAQNPMIDMIN
jgi:ABC-type arginine/histidine transport system permease subunit